MYLLGALLAEKTASLENLSDAPTASVSPVSCKPMPSVVEPSPAVCPILVSQDMQRKSPRPSPPSSTLAVTPATDLVNESSENNSSTPLMAEDAAPPTEQTENPPSVEDCGKVMPTETEVHGSA